MGEKIHEFGGEHDYLGTPQRLFVFHCPGCKYGHHFQVPRWTWNGSMDKPTFNPSLLVYGGGESPRCHSFVRDGKIEFLSDCGHAMAGQTVEIPDWED